MGSTVEPFRIVLALDFSDTARCAFEEAVDLARRHARPELHIVSVVANENGELLPSESHHLSMVELADRLRERLTDEVKRVLDEQRAKHPQMAKIPAVVHVRVGDIAGQITSLANEIEANVVVLGTHGRRGVKRLLLGSVAERTVRLAPCPVFVVRARNFDGMAGLPVIEPACPDCLAVRKQTENVTWWCAQHESKPEAEHTYSYSRRLDDPASPAPWGGGY